VGKKEEKTQETQALPTQTSHKDVLMVSSVPGVVVSLRHTDEKIAKAVDELQ
jgi:hypothetical protein